eukprot:6204371-Pleurochrysis_carterae.AAC.1
MSYLFTFFDVFAGTEVADFQQFESCVRSTPKVVCSPACMTASEQSGRAPGTPAMSGCHRPPRRCRPPGRAPPPPPCAAGPFRA